MIVYDSHTPIIIKPDADLPCLPYPSVLWCMTLLLLWLMLIKEGLLLEDWWPTLM